MRVTVRVAFALLLTISGPARADDIPGGYPKAVGIADFVYATPQQCIDVTVDSLAALGWRVARPAAGSVMGQRQDGVVILADCNAKVLAAASDRKSDSRGTMRDAAYKQIVSAIDQRSKTRFVGGRRGVELALTGATPAWHSALIEPRIAIRKVIFPTEVRCRDAAKFALGKNYSVRPQSDYESITIDRYEVVSALLQCSSRTYGGLLAAQYSGAAGPSVNRELAAIANALIAHAAEAAISPAFSIYEVRGTVDPARCRSVAEGMMGKYDTPWARVEGGVAASSQPGSETVLLCGPSGQAAIIEGGGGTTYSLTDFEQALAATTVPTATTKPSSYPIVNKLAFATIEHDMSARDCRDAAATTLRAAGYDNEGAITYGHRIRFAASAGVSCSLAPGWSAIAAIADPVGGRSSAGELARLRQLFEIEARKPRWISQSLGLRMDDGYLDFPREPKRAEAQGPTGRWTMLSARYAGADYVAWTGPAFPDGGGDAQLDRLLETLVADGLSVRTTRRAIYDKRPSLAVWGERPGRDGMRLKSIARYVFDRNRLIGVEVNYPDGVDVTAALAHFSDSLRLPWIAD